MIRRSRSSPGITRIRPTTAGCQPNRADAIFGARRSFASSTRCISSVEPMSDFTSTTATARYRSLAPRTSIEPRSPKSENETSTAVSQRRRSSSRTVRSTRDAWRSSSSRSAAAPSHQTPNQPRALTASNIRRRRSSETEPAPPASTAMTSRRGTRATRASAACVTFARRRSRRSRRPTRMSSPDRTLATMDGSGYRALIANCGTGRNA
jgi:hypothetical protein